MSDLPQPLTPADCDLRDFQFMPLDVSRLLTSETWVLGTGDERAAAMTLWLVSWHQVPAASLPADDRMLGHLSQSKNWKRVKPHALRGWIPAADGRLYHPVVAEKALEAWIEKLLNSLSGSVGNAKRWGVDIDTEDIRARFLTAVDLLKNLAPQSKTLRKKAVLTMANSSPPESRGESPPESPPESPSDRNRQGQGQGQGLLTTKPVHSASTQPEYARAPDQPQDEDGKPETPVTPTPAALLSQVMRKHGVMSNPGDPRLIALAEQGVTVETVAAACEEARQAKPNERISPAYIAAIIERWSKEAKAIDVAGAKPPEAKANGAGAQAADRWWLTDQGIVRKGKELGMYARGTESYADFKDRIFTKLREQGATA
jgi:hypothetical protein